MVAKWGPGEARRDPYDGYPICVVQFLRTKHWTDANRHIWPVFLAQCGRSIARARLAAELFSTIEILEADYHAYAGVSSCRTALDAFARWLNGFLESPMPLSNPIAINVTRNDFKKAIGTALSTRGHGSAIPHLDALKDLGDEIDIYRQLAQHRDGLFVRSYFGAFSPGQENVPDPLRWRIAKPGEYEVTAKSEIAVNLIRRWTDAIEIQVCAILALPLVAPPVPGEA
jgi:hypothetical protein